MNLKPFQEFVRIFEFCLNPENSNYSNQTKQNTILASMPQIRKKYLKLNITDDNRIIELETRKFDSMFREIILYLDTCHTYEIEDKHKYLLMLTNNPKFGETELWNHIRLPFKEIFIDVDFDMEDVGGEEVQISGILVKEMKQIVSDIKDKEVSAKVVYGLTAYVSGITLSNAPFVDRFYFPIYLSDNGDIKEVDADYDNRKIAKFIQKFVINFILFLKDREVVWIESKRTEKNQKRRIKDGKIPLPDSKVIKLTGELKRYVDSIADSDFKGKLSYQFWVSGHFRTYRSSRYKDSKGKVQFIEPFKKGQGVEVKHRYRVMDDKDANELNYDDIKPLDRPMRLKRMDGEYDVVGKGKDKLVIKEAKE